MKQPKRNHLEILEEITQLLSVNGFDTERGLLENEIRASSTGGELCIRSGSILLTLKNKTNIEKAIGQQIEELIDYCHFNGLYPRPKS